MLSKLTLCLSRDNKFISRACGVFLVGVREAIFCLLLCGVLFPFFFQPVLMEELIDTWRNMSLSKREESGYTLRSDQQSQKFILNICYWHGKLSHDDKSCELWIQSKGTLLVSEQQVGPSLRVSPHRSASKGVIVVPGMFERTHLNL